MRATVASVRVGSSSCSPACVSINQINNSTLPTDMVLTSGPADAHTGDVGNSKADRMERMMDAAKAEARAVVTITRCDGTTYQGCRNYGSALDGAFQVYVVARDAADAGHAGTLPRHLLCPA